ncbi:MAG: accessory factor UbiK family protein [Gammaproteobacteria bacterium]|nr:accessory factor UbiK family protein [Gammaproteobacteria bacterium]NNC96778.1 accessory factor UbiK family protein [Gammaproteobacteria bacterium]NNM14965.1 accessory factor UbiK family protein [Gammaproteobacteria bacterium]
MDPKFIDELSQRFYKNLPDNLKHLGEDLKRHFSNVLEKGLDKVDLVSRDEFEVQKLILEKCRKRIDELKAQISKEEE